MSSDFAPELQPHEYGPTPEDSMHRSLDDHLKHPASGERLSASREQAPSDVGLAPLADAPDDVEALARLLFKAVVPPSEWIISEALEATVWPDCARALLASDWLAARDADLTARAEARGAAAVLAAVEKAAKNAHECPPVRAARAAAASYTRDGAE